MKALPASFALCVGLAAAAPVGAQQVGTSGEGALFLLLPIGAQAVSLGRAMTAVQGPEGAFWNPAGLASVRHSQLVVSRGDQVAGTATAASGLLARGGVGTLGISYLLLDVGDQDVTDLSGNTIGTISVRNHLAVLSGAARLLENVSVGMSFKAVVYRFVCRGLCPDGRGTTSKTYAFDFGIQATPFERLRLGAMIAHVGPDLQVKNADQSDPLPSRYRIAASYDIVDLFTSREEFEGWVTVEVQDRLRTPGVPALYLGTEFTAGLEDALSLRAGYVMSDLRNRIQGADPEDGARVGLGLRYGRFDLSIAKSLTVSNITGETEPVHVTLSIGF